MHKYIINNRKKIIVSTLCIIVLVTIIKVTSSFSIYSNNEQTAPQFIPDYIIVGAGAGGGVLAARLAEDKNTKVLLIEAGPDNTKEEDIIKMSSFEKLWTTSKNTKKGSPSNLAFVTIPQNGKIYAYPRGTGLGGSVNHHAGVDGRGSDVIYDNWAETLDDKSWSADNLRPIFIKMENYDVPNSKKEAHGQNGWLHIRKDKIVEEMDHSLISTLKESLSVEFREDFYDNPEDKSGIGAEDIQMHNDGRRSYVINDLLLPRQRENQENGWNNLNIVTDQLVTKVIFKDKHAIGVEVIDGARAYQADDRHIEDNKNSNKITYIAKKEVILCGGAINTPQILMLSGVGPKDELEKLNIKVIEDLPGVGKNLIDHMEVTNIYEIKNLPNKVWRMQANYLSQIDPSWEKWGDKELLNEGGLPLVWDWFSDYDARDKRNPDLHISIVHSYLRDFNFDPKRFNEDDPLKASWINKYIKQKDPKNPVSYFGFLTEILKVNSKTGSIKLASNNPTEAPLIDPQLNKSDEDLTRLAMGIQLQRKIMQKPEMQKYEPVEVLPGPNFKTLEQLKDYISRYSSFGHHISGTAKMGKASDPMAVTNSSGLVRGVTGLRICDASLAPEMPGYNTSRPTYMIGEVIAEKIKSEK